MKGIKIVSVFLVGYLVLLLISATVFFYVERQSFGSSYLNQVANIASKYKLDAVLVLAIIKTESGFNEDAISPKGAIGLMQLMPSTAREVYEKVYGQGYSDELAKVPAINLELGMCYLSQLIEESKSVKWAICAYNAGLANAKKWAKNNLADFEIPFKETKNYLVKVKGNIKGYKFFRGYDCQVAIEK